MITEWLMKFIKNAPEDVRRKVGEKNLPKIQKKLNKLYKRILLWDDLLESLYGLDSQVYINFHDELNILSIDRDRN